jgi:quinoprotein relay system zinc metallohydrolase 2
MMAPAVRSGIHVMPRSSLVCALLLSFATVAGGPVTASGPNEFVLEEIAEGIYLHRGRHVGLDDPARGDSANIGFIEGERCVAVVDSGGSVATGAELARSLSGRVEKPVCYVINTHVHFDHVLGNGAFADADVQFIGHRNLAEALPANRAFFTEFFAAELGTGPMAEKLAAPQVQVDDRIEIDLGDRPVVIEAHGAAHTNTDVTIHDLKTDTLWAGDLLFRERMPILDGSLKGWLEWMDAAMRRKYALVIPGHGPPDRAWPEGAAAQYRYLEALLEETRAAVAAGVFIEDAKGVVADDERARWQLSERAHPRNVSRAYRELEWE